MFLEHREKEENKRQATAGYDLTDAYAQISYCLPGEPCPKTISLQADQEQYLIPGRCWDGIPIKIFGCTDRKRRQRQRLERFFSLTDC